MKHSMLCIGGPLDGKRCEVTGTTLRVPVLKSPVSLSQDPGAPTDYEEVIYRGQLFLTSKGRIGVWVPDRQTFQETMTLLLEGYRAGPSGGS